MHDVVRGAEAALGRAFAKNVNVNRKTTIVDIVEIASMGGEMAKVDKGLSAWNRVGARRCGVAVVNASWLVAFFLPEATVPQRSPIVAMIALTTHGWRVWYPTVK